MKQKKIIFAALLAAALLALIGGYSFYEVQQSRQRVSSLTASLQEKEEELAALQETLSQTEDSLAGQADYVKELTAQIDSLAGFADTDEDGGTSGKDTKDEASGKSSKDEASGTGSKSQKDGTDKTDAANQDYQDKYPNLYSQAEYEKREKAGKNGKDEKNGSSQDKETEKFVYLTFDDGPSDLTPKVLDLLDQYDAKATFFVVYKDEEAYTEYLSEIVSRGHTLALHSYSHDYKKIYASVDAFLADFQKVYDWVYEETGVRPTLFRFPGGSNNGKKSITDEIIAEMERRGFLYYDWNVSSGDGSNLTTSDNILENICTNVGNYDFPVVLMHDGPGKHATLNALPQVLKTLEKKGYSFQALDESMEPVQYQRSSRSKE